MESTSNRPASAPALDDASFAALASLIHERCGIKLRTGKQMLVLSRLSARMRELKMRHLSELVAYLEQPQGEGELARVIDAISTNVTELFRHPRHFEIVADLTRKAVQKGKRRFRYWSAACSSGEEPYSLAMTILDAAGDADVDLKILATDISTRILARAMTGEYAATDLRALPSGFERKYFVPGSQPGTARVNERLRRAIKFRHYNLSGRPLPLEGVLDGVFCRNVMIYFDRPLRQHLVREAARLVRRGGYFFVGQSESLTGLDHGPLMTVEPSVYVRR